MTATSSAPSQPITSDLTLLLSSISHLFNPPPINPLSNSPAEQLGISGADHLFHLLHFNRQLQRVENLTILLAPDQSLPSAADIENALHRFAEARITREQRELRNIHRHGWKVALVALLALAICTALSSFFASEYAAFLRPLFRNTFEYGFEIVGWVMLWNPVDVLVFTPITIRARIAALRTLAALHVTLRADQVPTSSQ